MKQTICKYGKEFTVSFAHCTLGPGITRCFVTPKQGQTLRSTGFSGHKGGAMVLKWWQKQGPRGLLLENEKYFCSIYKRRDKKARPVDHYTSIIKAISLQPNLAGTLTQMVVQPSSVIVYCIVVAWSVCYHPMYCAVATDNGATVQWDN